MYDFKFDKEPKHDSDENFRKHFCSPPPENKSSAKTDILNSLASSQADASLKEDKPTVKDKSNYVTDNDFSQVQKGQNSVFTDIADKFKGQSIGTLTGVTDGSGKYKKISTKRDRICVGALVIAIFSLIMTIISLYSFNTQLSHYKSNKSKYTTVNAKITKLETDQRRTGTGKRRRTVTTHYAIFTYKVGDIIYDVRERAARGEDVGDTVEIAYLTDKPKSFTRTETAKPKGFFLDYLFVISLLVFIGMKIYIKIAYNSLNDSADMMSKVKTLPSFDDF